MWDIDDALRLVRAIQEDTKKFGYHVCLGGSVLNKGLSHKNVDLYFLPMDNGMKSEAKKVVSWLEEMWGKSEELGREYPDSIDTDGPPDHVGVQITSRGLDWGVDETAPLDWERHVRYWRVQGTTYTTILPETRPTSSTTPSVSGYPGMKTYSKKLKFIRPDGERIDVFIIGG